MRPLSLLVVDDQPMARRGIRQSIDWQSIGVAVVGEASNGKEAVDFIEASPPDVVLADIRMPVMDGLELVERVRATRPSIVFVIISGYDDFDYAQRAVRLGVSDYLLKPVGAEELVRTIERIREQRTAPTFAEQRAIVRARVFADGLGGSLSPYEFDKAIAAVEMEQINKTVRFCAITLAVGEAHKEHGWLERREDEIATWLGRSFAAAMHASHSVPAGRRFFVYARDESAANRMPQVAAGIIADCQREWGVGALVGVGNAYSGDGGAYRSLNESVKALDNAGVDPSSHVILFGSSEERQTEIRTAGRTVEIPMSAVEQLAALVRRGLREESLSLVDELLSSFWKQQPTIVEARNVLSQLLIVVSLESRSFSSTGAGDRDPHSSALYRFHWLISSKCFRSVVREEIVGMIRTRSEHTGDLVSLALDKMHGADTHQVTLAGIADQLGVSSGYLGTLIRKQTGHKFTEVLNDIRMKKAMTLLENPRLRVSDIADAVGLRDLSHFHQVFRQHVGMTPTEFRNRSIPIKNQNPHEQKKEERDAGKQG